MSATGTRTRLRRMALAAAREVAHRGVLVPFVHSLVRVKVTGRDELDDMSGAFVVVANHASHLDAPVLFAGLPRATTRRLATAAAADYFFDSRWRSLPTVLFFNAFPVQRDGAKSRSGLSRAVLAGGSPLLVFPEGGRARSEGHRRFKPGAAALAISCSVPCVPVAVVGAREAMPRGARWPVRGRPPVELVIGAPMSALPGEDVEEFSSRLMYEVERLSRRTDRPITWSEPDPADSSATPGRDVMDDRVIDLTKTVDRSGMTPTTAGQASHGAGSTGLVEHMKWWGWGREEVSFHSHDKPAFAPFLQRAIGVDAAAPPAPVIAFDELDVPSSRLDAALHDALVTAVSADHVHTDDLDRVVHTYGKSVRDLMRLRAGDLPRCPDVVVYPADEAEVESVMAAVLAHDAVLIPFGGGSNIAGCLQPQPAETRMVVSLDLGRMATLTSLDAESGLATIGAGALGPAIEAQLGAQGWTLGHFPDSFTHSSLGGWVATRSSGMQSDKYGDIADIVRGLRMVRPDGVLALRPLPSTSTGPSVREMVLGSEGRLGVITEVTVQVHRVPADRRILGYLFPSWDAGLAAMAAIAASDAHPSITRISDAGETEFSFSTRKAGGGVSSLVTKGLMAVLKRRGWKLDRMCLSFIGYEGSAAHVRYSKAIVHKIVREHGGMPIGAGPGVLYDQKKFDTPYIRDFLLDRGAVADVSETAAPWAALPGMYRSVMAAARAAFDEIGVTGWVMCHLSHSYHSGACLYFTFAFAHGADPVAEYEVVKNAIQQTFIDAAGTLSHHHGVGVEHSPWMEQDISAPGLSLLRGVFSAADPGNNLNPGKIAPDVSVTAGLDVDVDVDARGR